MSSELALGIDIGTEGVKGELVTPNGTILARARAENSCSYPQADWCEQDMELCWWRNPARVIRSLMQTPGIKPGQIKAVSASGLFPALGPTDGNGAPLREAILYSDNRALAEVEEINAALSLQITTEELTPKLLWLMRNQPELGARMKMFFDPPHYLVYRLCGEYVTDTILAGRYGAIYHSPTATWRREVCERFGIPMGILPKVRPPAEIVGNVHAEAAEATGLAVGTPVLTGMPDLAASLIGAGVVHTYESVAYYGSAGLIPVMKQNLIQAIWKPYPHEERGITPLDGYLFDFPVYSLSVGEAARWFKEQLARLEMAQEENSKDSAYEQLHRLAAEVPPGSDGVVMLPYLHGQRSPVFNPRATGVFFGLRASHNNSNLFRAILEAFGYSIRYGLESAYPDGHPLKRLVATGGGARSPLWRQIVSDITGLRQEYIPEADEALGNAYLAGIALGWFNDFENLQKGWLKAGAITEPDPANQAAYETGYAAYIDLHAALEPVFARHHPAESHSPEGGRA